ncbi:hypothetical protein HK099_003096 [Clydaea vesicula]|uniref:Zinc finger CHCC-type domain-containing protein n=1 Tax=Clydaea vesicula TaxID=447962 RepID=A0AAD5U241_9FUNG|nr:hypothetical protein HK099_003096 [Clydaea vesicula]
MNLVIKSNRILNIFRITPKNVKLSTKSSTPATELKSELTLDEVLSQSPNRVEPWSKSQRPRKSALSGPRFEQIDLAAQPKPLAAIELINAEPIKIVHERVVACDGGGGALGHPKVYINLVSDHERIKFCIEFNF